MCQRRMFKMGTYFYFYFVFIAANRHIYGLPNYNMN